MDTKDNKQTVTIHNSVCPYDCPDACGLIVNVKDNRVLSVTGNPKHTYTRGTLCPKMIHYEDTVHSPERLTTPLKRVGPKGSGQFVPITWDEAAVEIAARFKDAIERYGGESIMPYSYAGTMGLIQGAAGDPLFARLGATRQDRGICSPAKRHGWQVVMGKTFGTRSQEMKDSDLVILWSLNAINTNIHIMHDVKQARSRGAKVWVIDIYESTTCDIGDEVVITKPGSDGALALGLVHILDRDGLIDRGFIDQYVQGYDELKEQILPRYTPEYVSKLTGVSVERLEELATAYGQAKAPFIRLGSGLSRYGNGAMTVRTVLCLPAVVSAYAKPGGGFLGSTSGSAFVGKQLMAWDAHTDNPGRLIPMIKLGPALHDTEKPIKCLYIYSSNPAITLPDQNVVRSGLMRDDLFIVVHERFMTDTAKYADIVLPATTSLEHDDIYNSYGHYFIGLGLKAIEPIGESRSNWDTMRTIAKALGIKDSFFDKTAYELIVDTLNASLRLTDEERARILAGEPVEMRLPENYKMDFKTPSHKIEILNETEDDILPIYKEPHGDDADYWLINAPDPRILDSSFTERQFSVKGSQKPLMAAYINPDDPMATKVTEGDSVYLTNCRGRVQIPLYFDKRAALGTVVTYGVWSQRYSSDKKVGINVLTASRATDRASGSTFYDVKVNIEVPAK